MHSHTLTQLLGFQTAATKADRIRTAPFVKAVRAAIAANDDAAHFNAVNALRAAEIPAMAPMTQDEYAAERVRLRADQDRRLRVLGII